MAASTPRSVRLSGQARNVSGIPDLGETSDVAVVVVGTDVAEGVLTGRFDFVDHGVISAAGHLHVERILTQGDDTIDMEIEADFGDETATTQTVSGRWTIRSGTGAYENLRGSGSIVATVTKASPHSISETLDGFASFNPSN